MKVTKNQNVRNTTLKVIRGSDAIVTVEKDAFLAYYSLLSISGLIATAISPES